MTFFHAELPPAEGREHSEFPRHRRREDYRWSRVRQDLAYQSEDGAPNVENCEWLVKRLGIQMELDLRLPEIAMPNPPTGYVNVSGADYARIDEEWSRQQCTSELRLFFDRANYPGPLP